jgi:hypothetical protein
MTALVQPQFIERWTRPEPRLPGLIQWLTGEVWTAERFRECGSKPSEYLQSGERIVNEWESLLTAAADSYFAELTTVPSPARKISDFFRDQPEGCVLVLDGCSLRELPRLLELAHTSRRPVVECACGRSAIPSATEHFVKDRLGFGFPATGPSQLVSRREWRDLGIGYHYFREPNESQHISEESAPILLWHRFPDLRFMDSTASSAEFYDSIWDTLGLVWQRTVQALPPSRTVLVTSDHGYVFLGSGFSDRGLDGSDHPLNGKRSREFASDEPLPTESPGLHVDSGRRVAVIRGRCHNRPQAPSPSRSLFRHEGLSLMEVLTPWLVLGPVGA